MQKFQESSLAIQAIKVYLLSFLCSLIVSPLFGKLYIYIYKPKFTTGAFFLMPSDPYALFDGAFFASFLFLSFFIFWLIKQKQWLIWLIGVIFPLSIALIGGTKKDIFLATVLTIIGYLLAQGVLLVKNKK